MSSIAIFPCTFTPAHTVANALAKALDIKLYEDSDLLAETSQKYGTSIEKLQQAMHGKTSVFNQFTLEKEKMLNHLRSVLAEKLEQPDRYMFYGFMTALISQEVSHVLKVLLVGTRQTRIAAAITTGLTEKEAKKAVRSDDVKAYGLTDFLYKKEAYDSSLYDLVVPVELKSDDDLVDIVFQYFHKISILRTAQSQQAVQDMKLETMVESSLLLAGHKIAVSAHTGEIVLKVQKSVLNFDKLVSGLTSIVSQVDGVTGVDVKKSKDYNDSIYRQQNFDLPSKVLFVDDEKDFVQTVSERLISRDVGTYGVFNGEQALSVIEEDRPDVMVLDLKMPGLHGVEVLRQTKRVAPEVEVIILTGHGSSQDMLECMELGAFAYMNKPVDIEELSATIKAAYKKVSEVSEDN
ncbi:response regulator [Desulfosediminicola flagellatus]|uniref:response regulator n=1 Tax=Desulfosediminicola flagellatus TaxID=2569541 RepID=UPI00142EE06A|nr:response regulator [Desulfosediminicola flagellatus]